MENYKMPTNMSRRGAVYYARVGVPIEYREIIGKNEVWKSLGTKNFNKAKQLLSRTVVEIQSQWDNIEQEAIDFLNEFQRRMEPSFKSIGEDHTAFIAKVIFDEDLRQDAIARKSLSSFRTVAPKDDCGYANLEQMVDAAMKNPAVLDDSDFKEYAARRTATKNVLELALRTNSISPLYELTNAFAFFFSLDIEADEEYEKLAHAIIRAKLAAISQMEAMDAGMANATPTDSIVTDFLSKHAFSENDSVWDAKIRPKVKDDVDDDILKLHDLYIDGNPKGCNEDTLQQNQKSVILFLDSLEATPSLKDFNRTKVREWRSLLKQLPVRATEQKCFQGMSIREITEANKEIGKPVASSRTVNKHLNQLSAFCNWLMIEGHIDSNPVSRMLVPEMFDPQNRKPFTIDQLNSIFASSLFNGCKDELKWHLSGETRIRDHRFWLPLIGLYTGARLAEIAQALVSDFEKVHGIWVFRISTMGDASKSLKNKSSERIIPLHKHLIDLGFGEFLKSTQGNPEDRLFPEVTRNSRGQIAGDFSRKWGKYLTQIGVKTDKSINFHSFRHTFTDELRRAGHNDTDIGLLLGHRQQSMTARYGLVTQGTIEQRALLIDSIQYDGLEFPFKG